MVNAWSLLYDELNGTMDETFPVKKSEPNDNVVISTGSTASETWVNFDLNDKIENITIDTSNHETLDFSTLELPDGMTVNYDMDPALSYMEPGTELKIDTDSVYADTWPHAETLNIKIPDDGIPLPQNFLADNDDNAAHHFTTPGIKIDCTRKYKEDESIEALKNYISTTYNGH